VSQADISAKAIAVSSGKVLVVETAHVRRPFDSTGNIALEKAAEALSGKLLEGIEQFLSRDTVDYRLVVLNIDHSQSLRLQEALQNRLQGVRKVREQGFIKNTLELDVSVEKQRDIAFQGSLFAGFMGLGAGSFTVVAAEEETIYLRRTGDAVMSVPSKSQGSQAFPPSGDDRAQSRTEPKIEQPPPVSTTTYQPGYRKSWAVVLGINNYQQWPKLAYAVKDAAEIQQRLKRLGFNEVIPVLLHFNAK
jgi:hypothetical protein